MISFVTVAAMYRGALKKSWGQKRMAELDSHFRQFAVVPYNFQICLSFARITNSAERSGSPITMADAFIAACALSPQIPLLTNNRRHCDGIDELRVTSAR